MDWTLFCTTLAVGVGLVAVQGICSAFDHRFSSAQMNHYRIERCWSFLQHGGMWADVLIISPIVAFVLGSYRLDYTSWWGIGTYVFSLVLTLVMVEFYRRMGIAWGDHCTHDGKTKPAGWVHAAFAFAAIWILLEVFLGLTTPVVSNVHLVIIAIWMTPFFYLGVKKFHHSWVMSTQDKRQIAALTIGMWVIVLIRITYA